jgi:hypothetical protein
MKRLLHILVVTVVVFCLITLTILIAWHTIGKSSPLMPVIKRILN